MVMAVSWCPASVVAEVSLVSTSPCHSCLCAKKFALLGPMVGVSAKKFALRAQNGPNSAFYGALGELFRGTVAERTVLGELFRGTVAERSVLGEFFRAYRHGSHVSHVMWRPTCRKWWGGFARHEALWLRVAGVSEPHVVQFPRVVAGVVCVLAEVLAAGPFDWQC